MKTRTTVVVLLAAAAAAALAAAVIAGVMAGASGSPGGGVPAEERIDSAFGIEDPPIPIEGGCAVDGACADPGGTAECVPVRSTREETP